MKSKPCDSAEQHAEHEWGYSNGWRAARDDAPHAKDCAALIPMHFHKPWPCDCWKAEVR